MSSNRPMHILTIDRLPFRISTSQRLHSASFPICSVTRPQYPVYRSPDRDLPHPSISPIPHPIPPLPHSPSTSPLLSLLTTPLLPQTHFFSGKSLGKHLSLFQSFPCVSLCCSNCNLLSLTSSFLQNAQSEVSFLGLTGRPFALTGARVPALSAALCSRAMRSFLEMGMALEGGRGGGVNWCGVAWVGR